MPSYPKAVLLSVMWLFAGFQALRADFITTLTAESPTLTNGLYNYSYTLANATNSDLPAVVLDVGVPGNADLQLLIGPVGWDIVYSQGDPVISWQASDAPFSLMPGDSAVFAFASPLPAGSEDFAVLGFDPNSFAFGENNGTVIALAGQSPLPEPTSLTLLALGSLSLLGYGWRRRKAIM